MRYKTTYTKMKNDNKDPFIVIPSRMIDILGNDSELGWFFVKLLTKPNDSIINSSNVHKEFGIPLDLFDHMFQELINLDFIKKIPVYDEHKNISHYQCIILNKS